MTKQFNSWFNSYLDSVGLKGKLKILSNDNKHARIGSALGQQSTIDIIAIQTSDKNLSVNYVKIHPVLGMVSGHKSARSIRELALMCYDIYFQSYK